MSGDLREFLAAVRVDCEAVREGCYGIGEYERCHEHSAAADRLAVSTEKLARAIEVILEDINLWGCECRFGGDVEMKKATQYVCRSCRLHVITEALSEGEETP